MDDGDDDDGAEVGRTKSAHVAGLAKPNLTLGNPDRDASLLSAGDDVSRTVSGGSPHRVGRIRPAQERGTNPATANATITIVPIVSVCGVACRHYIRCIT